MLDRPEVARPYPGLRPFEPYENEIFFGREAHTDRLLEILQRERFLAVLGPSGAGKSSLVRAGMLPALAAGWLGSGSDWRIAILRPGDRPFRRLAEALQQPDTLGNELRGDDDAEDSPAAALVEAELRRGPLGLVHLVADAVRTTDVPQPWNLLVLVDQFEEIFRYRLAGSEQADEAEAFVNLLLASRTPEASRIHVALTMRTDFLGHCVRFLELPEAINRAQYLIPRLTRAELDVAIRGPARVFGGDVAPELVNELINSVTHDLDQLPLLQHALARMWEAERDGEPAGAELTLDSLAGLGGLAGALSAHAEQVLATLTPEQQRLAETLFRSITVQEGSGEGARRVRRPQRLQEIATAAGCSWQELAPVVRAFAEEGVNFLSHGQPLDADSVIDISHESLIRQWERLRDWVADESERASEYRRWRERATERGQGGELLTGADLARAVAWREGTEAWRPTAEWARRYASGGAASGELEQTLTYVGESEARENERQRSEAAARERQLELERRAAEAQAATERARTEAAVREREQAEAYARQARRRSIAASGAAVAAILFAIFAGWFKHEADIKSQEALARQLEAAVRLDPQPDRAELVAVEAYRTLQTPFTEQLVREAYSRALGQLRTYRGHRGVVRSAAFSPDGRLLVTASEDGTARLWDASTGREVATLLGHQGAVVGAAFSPDGRHVVTAGEDGTARFWDAATGHALPIHGRHRDAIASVAWSPDGRSVVTASEDGTAWLWDASTCRRKTVLSGHDGAVWSAAFSPDGTLVATAGSDNTARVWEASTGRPLVTLLGHSGSVLEVAWSPDGGTLATASEDETAGLWEASTGRRLATLGGQSDTVLAVAFSLDGRKVVTASADKTARLWDASTGALSAVLTGHTGEVWSAAFSPDGRTVVTASRGNAVRLWDASTGRPLAVFNGHEDGVRSAVFSPDGRTVVTASEDKTARLWDASTGGAAAVLSGHGGHVWTAVFSADARSLWTVIWEGRVTVMVREASTGQWLSEHSVDDGEASSAALSNDGRVLATAGSGGTTRLWEASTGRPLAVLAGHHGLVRSAAFSPDGASVATASDDGTARLWEASTGRQLAVLIGHEGPVRGAAFSPDGGTVATAGEDGTARLWQALTRKSPDILSGHEGPVTSAAFSPDGSTVVTSSEDKTARLWEASTGERLVTLSGHQRDVRSAAFSPDGRTVVTASDDGTARLWESTTGRPLAVLTGHQGAVWSAAFSPDGRTVVTTGADHTARIWPCAVCAPTEELADEILRRVGRTLTAEERKEAGLPAAPVAEAQRGAPPPAPRGG